MSTKAAVLIAFREPLQIREYPEPPSPGPGEAIVRVEMAGICGTDVHLWLGQLPIPLPVILGHETAGRLEKLGSGLQKDWRGKPPRGGGPVTLGSPPTCRGSYYIPKKRQPPRCGARKAF